MRLSPNPDFKPTVSTKDQLRAQLIQDMTTAIAMLKTYDTTKEYDPDTGLMLEQLEDTLITYMRTPPNA